MLLFLNDLLFLLLNYPITYYEENLLKECSQTVDRKMGKKHIEINIVKNPQDQNLTFISDPLKGIVLHYSKQQKNNDNSSEMILIKNW